MKLHAFKSIGAGGLALAVLLIDLSNGRAATLADWRLGEATNGTVVSSVDSSGHPLRDLHPATVTDGFSGSAAPTYTSFPAFPGSDGRGVSFNGFEDVLITSNTDVFANSEFVNGFTLEVVYKMPTLLPNDGRRALLTIGQWWGIWVMDLDPTATVTPEVAFEITGSFGSALRTGAPDTNGFHHVAGIYDPSMTIDGVNTSFLYLDYSLVAKTNAFALAQGLDGDNKFSSVGGRPYSGDPFSAYSTIDRVRISDSVLSTAEFIPEPSAAVLLLGTGGLLLRRRRD